MGFADTLLQGLYIDISPTNEVDEHADFPLQRNDADLQGTVRVMTNKYGGTAMTNEQRKDAASMPRRALSDVVICSNPLTLSPCPASAE